MLKHFPRSGWKPEPVSQLYCDASRTPGGVNAMCTFTVWTCETYSDTTAVPKSLTHFLGKLFHQIKPDQSGHAPKMSTQQEQDVTNFKGGRIGPKVDALFGCYLTKIRGRFSAEFPEWKFVTNSFQMLLFFLFFLKEVRQGGSVAHMLISYCWNYRSDGGLVIFSTALV